MLGISHSKLNDEINELEGKTPIIFRVKGESEQLVTGNMIVLAVPHKNREKYTIYECTLTNDQSYIDDYFNHEFE